MADKSPNKSTAADTTASKTWSKKRQEGLEGLGLLDPEKELLAKYVASLIPEGHWAHSPLMARAVGVLMGRFEGMADDFDNPYLSAVAEDVTDLVKAIMAILGENPSRASVEAFAKIDADWEQAFWEKSLKRIQEAKDEQAEKTEVEKVKREFILLTDLHTFIANSAKPKPPQLKAPEHRHKSFGEEMKVIGASLSHDARTVDAFAATHVAPLVRSLTATLKARQAARRR